MENKDSGLNASGFSHPEISRGDQWFIKEFHPVRANEE